jgi:hypothetical protein
LIVIGIVVLVAVVLARGRRVSRQPGAFRRLWRWPPAAARGVGSLFRQMGVSELPGCLRWEGG